MHSCVDVQALPQPRHCFNSSCTWPRSWPQQWAAEAYHATDVRSPPLHVQLMQHTKDAGRYCNSNLLGLHLLLCSSLFPCHHNDIVSVTRYQTKCYQPQTAHFLTIAETSIKMLLNRNKEQNVQLLHLISLFFFFPPCFAHLSGIFL